MVSVKRYALFFGEFFYAKGGVMDFYEASDDLEYLKAIAKDKTDEDFEWWHIVDFVTMNIVSGSLDQAHGACIE